MKEEEKVEELKREAEITEVEYWRLMFMASEQRRASEAAEHATAMHRVAAEDMFNLSTEIRAKYSLTISEKSRFRIDNGKFFFTCE